MDQVTPCEPPSTLAPCEPARGILPTAWLAMNCSAVAALECSVTDKLQWELSGGRYLDNKSGKRTDYWDAINRTR